MVRLPGVAKRVAFACFVQLGSYQMVNEMVDPLVPTTERKSAAGPGGTGVALKNLPYISTRPAVAVTAASPIPPTSKVA